MNTTLIRNVESVLFSAGRRLSLAEISKLCRKSEEECLVALKALQEELKGKEDTSLRVVQEGDTWKLTVREQFIATVEKLVTQTEYSKTVMETLAVIAYKAPVLQSEVIRIRTNKAYDHVKLLEEEGFITRKPEGRSKMIRLGQKFFDYFDLPEEVVAARFARVRQMEDEVVEKEKEHKHLKEKIRQQKEEMAMTDEEYQKKEDQKIEDLSKEIEELEPGALETYGRQETYTDDSPTQLEKVEEHVGDLDVYDATPKEGEKQHVGEFEVYKRSDKSPGGEPNVEESIKLSKEKTDFTPKESHSVSAIKEESKEELQENPGKVSEKPDESENPLGQATPFEKTEIKQAVEQVHLPKKEVPQEMVEVNIEKKEGKGMFHEGITPEVQKKIDKKIDELLHPPSEEDSQEEKKEEPVSSLSSTTKSNEEKSTLVENSVKPAADESKVPNSGSSKSEQQEEKLEGQKEVEESSVEEKAPPTPEDSLQDAPMFEETSEGKSGMNPPVPEHMEPSDTTLETPKE